MNKFKIPTILGLSIILIGIAAGVYLNFKEQVFLSRAAPDSTPQNITISNITEDSAVISWQTNSESPSFVTYGQNNTSEQTVLDDKDTTTPKPRLIHYATIKNLLPKTYYQFKIVSGKISSAVETFQTAQPLVNQTSFAAVIGTILEGDRPLENGIAYLSIPDAVIQSAPVKSGGNFLIPLSQIRKTDLSDYQLTEGTTAKLTIRSDKGETNALFKLKAASSPLPPIKLGQNLDLTDWEESPQPSPIQNADKYDLNNDGKINSADYATLTSCFGKRLSAVLPGNIICTEADMNEDAVVNQKDLDLMIQKFKELGVPTTDLPEKPTP